MLMRYAIVLDHLGISEPSNSLCHLVNEWGEINEHVNIGCDCLCCWYVIKIKYDDRLYFRGISP